MNRDFNTGYILKVLGSLLLVESIFLLLVVFVDLYYKENAGRAFLISAGITFLVGSTTFLSGRNGSQNIGKREGSLIVSLTWILFSVFGMLPFILTGSIPRVADAFFETMSGFTTTGSSILDNIESLPHAVLFWRSTTHWIGGLGIIVISMALLPVFGFSGFQIFSAEATGPTKDKIHPKIGETAKRLLAIYLALTFAETILLRIAGMNWFDAICHSFGTIATGGFSTKQDSIAFYNSPAIEYIIILFMVFSGVNFSLYYFLFKLKINKIIRNEELRVYLLIIIAFTFLLTVTRIDFNNLTTLNLGKTIREALFVVTSTISTTGFVTIDYNIWPVFTWFLIIILMMIGSSAGSTAGGMKVSRVMLTLKYSYYEFKQIIHPNAVFPVRYNGHILKDNVMGRIFSFVVLYIILILSGSLLLSFTGLGFIESFSAQITAISNVGPALSLLGPTNSFSGIPEISKWILSFSMLIGRLELFTVLVLFTPVFWKK